MFSTDFNSQNFISSSYDFDYPGERSTFEHRGGNFEFSPSEPDRCRFLKFKSAKNSSLIEYFQIGGFENRVTKIWIEFDPANATTVATFLEKKINIKLSDKQKSLGFYNTKNEKELKSLFKTIFDNNTFPIQYREKLELIVATGEPHPFSSEEKPLQPNFGKSLREQQAELDRIFHQRMLATNQIQANSHETLSQRADRQSRELQDRVSHEQRLANNQDHITPRLISLRPTPMPSANSEPRVECRTQ